MRNFNAAFHGVLAALMLALLPSARADVPIDSPFVDSTSRPIRVYYQKGSVTEEVARAMLGTAEEQWALQVDQMGFSPPWRVIDGVVEQGFNLYVYGATPTDGIEAIANVPSTPQTDCASLAAIAKEFAPQSYRTYGISHVFNHAVALGVDCIEPMLGVESWQEVTGAVGGDPGIVAVFRENVTQFQRSPERSLVSERTSEDDYYFFGAALFPLFIEEKFGQRDGKLLPQMWNASAQNGKVISFGREPKADVENRPTFIEGIDSVLKSKGSSFDTAFAEFTVWRTLTGAWDDGAHFQGGARYAGVSFDAQFALSDLPVAERHPEKLVGRYGSSHVLVDLGGAKPGDKLVVSVKADAPYAWAANLICLHSDAVAEVTPLQLEGSRTGSVTLPDASRCQAVALVVANLSDATFDANNPSGARDGNFVYSLELFGNPTLVSIDPASLPQGSQRQTLVATGSNLCAGSELAASFGGEGVSVESVQSVDVNQVSMVVSVDQAATPGPRDLTVTNGRGVAVTLEKALEVTEKQAVPDAGTPDPEAPDAGSSDPGEMSPAEPAGCGCGQTSSGMPAGLGAGLVLLLLAQLRRSGTPRRQA